MISIRGSNATVVEVSAAHGIYIRLLAHRLATRDNAAQVLLNIDQAGELAAALANLVDAAKRGKP